jgi:nitrite reductase (NAD(P)H)
MLSNWRPEVSVEDITIKPINSSPNAVEAFEKESRGRPRKKIVVVGLGMVGISFM